MDEMSVKTQPSWYSSYIRKHLIRFRHSFHCHGLEGKMTNGADFIMNNLLVTLGLYSIEKKLAMLELCFPFHSYRYSYY